MKLKQLNINSDRFSLDFELSGEEFKSLLELFPEVLAVAMLVDKAQTYHIVAVNDGVLIPRPDPRSSFSSNTVLPKMAHIETTPATDEELFVQTVIHNVERNTAWLINNLGAEPRYECPLWCAFTQAGQLKEAFKRWESLIVERTSGIEDPRLYSIAFVSVKRDALAETEAEKSQLKNDAVRDALEQLREVALNFYSGTLEGTEQPQSAGAKNNGNTQESS